MIVRNLLVPTDFSDQALCALQYALAFARDLGANVHVLNSYYIPIATIDADYVADQALWLEQSRQRALEEMAMLEQQHLKPSGVNYNCMVHPGPPMSDINETIKDTQIDLVILGTYDTGELTGFFSDFYTYAVRHAKAPVLLVPSHCRYLFPEKIVFAADLKGYDNPAILEFAQKLLGVLRAELILLHVHKSSDALNAEKQNESERLMRLFSEYRPRLQVLEAPDAEEAILQFAHAEHAHWIISVAHRYGFIEKLFHSSHTKKLAQQTVVPLLVLQDSTTK